MSDEIKEVKKVEKVEKVEPKDIEIIKGGVTRIIEKSELDNSIKNGWSVK